MWKMDMYCDGQPAFKTPTDQIDKVMGPKSATQAISGPLQDS